MTRQRVLCPACGRYLASVTLLTGTIVIIEVKCKTCGDDKEIVVRQEVPEAA